MFFQLAEIEKVSTSAQAMETSKEALSKLVFSSYSSSNTIKTELSSTVENILKDAKANCDVLQEIEDNALHGYFIPSTFEIDQLTMDKPGLPEWFAVVFQKQFEKQKQALDLTAKKLYSYLNLSESKVQYERQLQAFTILADRYKSLSEKDKVIDIISEAEKVKNKGNMVMKKYGSFCQQIAIKMIDFFEQACKKCQTFSRQIDNYMETASKNWNINTNNQQQKCGSEAKMNNFGSFYGKSLGGISHNHWKSGMDRIMNRSCEHLLKHSPYTRYGKGQNFVSTFGSDYYN